jgi:hypothetical protein
MSPIPLLAAIVVLWFGSLLSVARWRQGVCAGRGRPKGANSDWIFQVYLKGTGMLILSGVLWIIQ